MSLLACISLALSPLTQAAAPPPERPEALPLVDVFVEGEGYPSFRIPALWVTAEGTLLALAEGRRTRADHAANDIVLRRSEDGGASFAPRVVVAAAGDDALNNPCVVQVEGGEHAGRVLVMFQRYPEGCGERCVETAPPGPICRTLLVHSDDDGRTWSEPRDVTAQVKPAAATSMASGPGNGIVKRHAPNAGRILMPFNRGPYGAWRVFAAFSDDGGDTWSFGAEADDAASPGQANEVQFVERVDGSVLLNARAQGGNNLRKAAVSRDGGSSWSSLRDQPDLIEPQVMASLIRHSEGGPNGKGVLLYAGPRSKTAREHGALHLSYDDGESWPIWRELYSGGYAYSALAVRAGAILVLFERDGYERISLARVSLDWLTRAESR